MKSLAIGVDTWAAICLLLGVVAGGLGFAFTRNRLVGFSLFLLLAIVLVWMGLIAESVIWGGMSFFNFLGSLIVALPAWMAGAAVVFFWSGSGSDSKTNRVAGDLLSASAVLFHIVFTVFFLAISGS